MIGISRLKNVFFHLTYIRCLQDERGHTYVKQSYLERVWVLERYNDFWKSRLDKPEEQFRSQTTHSRAPKIGKICPDYIVYDDTSLKRPIEAGFFHG